MKKEKIFLTEEPEQTEEKCINWVTSAVEELKKDVLKTDEQAMKGEMAGYWLKTAAAFLSRNR